MKKEIKFNMHNVVCESEKTRVHYSLDNHVSGKPCVTIYAKDYSGSLNMFSNMENNSELMTDYFEKDRVRLFENDAYYTEARKAAIRQLEHDRKRFNKRYSKVA